MSIKQCSWRNICWFGEILTKSFVFGSFLKGTFLFQTFVHSWTGLRQFQSSSNNGKIFLLVISASMWHFSWHWKHLIFLNRLSKICHFVLDHFWYDTWNETICNRNFYSWVKFSWPQVTAPWKEKHENLGHARDTTICLHAVLMEWSHLKVDNPRPTYWN